MLVIEGVMRDEPESVRHSNGSSWGVSSISAIKLTAERRLENLCDVLRVNESEEEEEGEEVPG